MNITVHPSAIEGVVDAPPSKSLTQRAIAAGLLASGTTVILSPSFCNDSLAALQMAEALGAFTSRDENSFTVESGSRPDYPVTLGCGESGLALRMFSPVAALVSGNVTLTGEGSLLSRPVGMITDALSQMGVRVWSNNGLLPVRISGKLSGGRAVIDGSSGSQLLTGLLMALPLAESDSSIEVLNLRSRPYINLTLELLSAFGIEVHNEDFRYFTIPGRQSYVAREYTVEGDWSGAAFLLVSGAIGGKAVVNNLNSVSAQADRAVMQVFKDTGCSITESHGAVTVSRSNMRAFDFDATDAPDLFPPLAALASYCDGTSIIRGAGRLRHKESDRGEAIRDVLTALNIRSYIRDDEMLIEGGKVTGAVVSSHNDHRIAMMAAVMALGAGQPVTITGAEAVAKSFPEFFSTMAGLGTRIR
jgi:3-phosphoshikimate 1-carboxyvinyltransferase